ncbi:MAG: tetratricopeptide repeat protein, partial [Myxococcota bacterium]
VAASLGELLKWWLPSAPGSFLVTSRARLGIKGEQVLPVEPLAEAAAVALLRARGEEARGEPFAEDGDTLDALSQIVRKLDFIPMAIELAAAQTVALDPRELLPRLDSTLSLLVSTDPTADPRAASLRSALRSSWDLLEVQAQNALTECSLFSGAFDLAGAEAVLGDGPIPKARVLALLCDRSLLRTRRSETGTRFEMYAAVKEFARERLEARSDAANVHQAWAGYVLSATDTARARVRPEAVATLNQHRANLVRIARSALLQPGLDKEGRSFLALGVLARLQGPVSETLDLFDEALKRTSLPTETRCRLRQVRGLLRTRDGQSKGAIEDFERASVEAEALGDRVLLAKITTDWADLVRHLGDYDLATDLYQRALTMFTQEGDAEGRGLMLAALASVAHEAFELRRAGELFQESIAILETLSEAPILVGIRQNYALLLQESGEFAEAEKTFRDALERHRRLGNRRFEGITEFDLAGLALEQGRHREALERLGRACALAQEVGDRREIGMSTLLLATTQALLDLPTEAAVSFRAAEQDLRRVEEPGLLHALEVHRGQLDLLALRRQRVGGGGDEEALTAKVRATLRTAADWQRSGDELRLAVRVLLAESERVLDRAQAVIAIDGSWFALPGEHRVDLTARKALPAILRCLLEQELREPGASVAAEDLIRVGWPDTRSVSRATKNRLHVAIATLRKLGLAEHLARGPAGYQLRNAQAHRG